MGKRNQYIIDKEERSFLVRLPGKSIAFLQVKKWITDKWGAGRIRSIKSLGRRIYVVKFEAPGVVDYIINKGPWSFYNNYTLVAKWRSGIDVDHFQFNEIPIWVEM
jgi:hypothetical protein